MPLEGICTEGPLRKVRPRMEGHLDPKMVDILSLEEDTVWKMSGRWCGKYLSPDVLFIVHFACFGVWLDDSYYNCLPFLSLQIPPPPVPTKHDWYESPKNIGGRREEGGCKVKTVITNPMFPCK